MAISWRDITHGMQICFEACTFVGELVGYDGQTSCIQTRGVSTNAEVEISKRFVSRPQPVTLIHIGMQTSLPTWWPNLPCPAEMHQYISKRSVAPKGFESVRFLWWTYACAPLMMFPFMLFRHAKLCSLKPHLRSVCQVSEWHPQPGTYKSQGKGKTQHWLALAIHCINIIVTHFYFGAVGCPCKICCRCGGGGCWKERNEMVAGRWNNERCMYTKSLSSFDVVTTELKQWTQAHSLLTLSLAVGLGWRGFLDGRWNCCVRVCSSN